MWMFVLLSPSTGRGHSHGVLSTQDLIHFVIKAVWFGPTPFDHSHPTLTHPILMTRLKLWQKEKKSLWTEAETQAKRRICKLELKSFTQQVFSTNQRLRVGYKQGWFHQSDQLSTACLWSGNLNTTMAQTTFPVCNPRAQNSSHQARRELPRTTINTDSLSS